MNILFAGSGEFGLPTLQALLVAGHTLGRIYTQPDRPAGRGRKLTPTPIGQFALDRGLDLVRTSDLNSESLPPADLLVVIAFGQKISDEVANHARLGSINLHASRLPKYRGAAPINWAILNGETVTGNSIIRLAQRMDAGAVLGMSEVKIGEMETAGELHDRLAQDGAPLMLRVVEELQNGTAIETVQDESQATRALKLNREFSSIDWTGEAQQIARKIRGLYPWPGCRVQLRDEAGNVLNKLTLVRGRPGTASGSPPAGLVLGNHSVACGVGTLEVVEVQPEGKRPMPLAAYRNGHRWDAGVRVESIA